MTIEKRHIGRRVFDGDALPIASHGVLVKDGRGGDLRDDDRTRHLAR